MRSLEPGVIDRLRGIAYTCVDRMTRFRERASSSAYVRLFVTPSREYAMAMPAPTNRWTAEMARALPEDGSRYEVLDGELFVTPAPSWNHQRVVFLLASTLREYVRPQALGEVLLSPADIELSEERLVQPDVFVIPPTPGRRPQSWREAKSLLLVAEVLSPSTARADRTNKRDIFQDERVPEYWIVDPDARVIERWRPHDKRPEILAHTIEWQPDPATPALAIDLPAFFAEALD